MASSSAPLVVVPAAKKAPAFQWSLDESKLILDVIIAMKVKYQTAGKDWDSTPQKYKLLLMDFKGIVEQKDDGKSPFPLIFS